MHYSDLGIDHEIKIFDVVSQMVDQMVYFSHSESVPFDLLAVVYLIHEGRKPLSYERIHVVFSVVDL